jgi:hypothetical protein
MASEQLNRERWAAGVTPPKPGDGTWSEAPEVPPVLVGFNRHGEVVDVRLLSRRGMGTSHLPGCDKPKAARRREPRRRSVRSGPRRARAPGRLADDPEPEPVARLDGFWPASVRMVQHLERRRAKAAAA